MFQGSVASIAFAVGTLVSSGPTHANNGLTLIGTGAESVGMAGAGVAVARDTGALATNPAGLGQLTKVAFDAYLAGALAIDVAHADRFENDQRVANWFIPNLGFGISTPIAGTRLTVGVGMFGQAGAGSVYNDINTPFGGRDTLRAQFGVLKFVPGIAWQATPQIALGFALNVYYASFKQRVFPNTSVFSPGNQSGTFFGTQLENASTVRVGGKAGVMVKPSSALSLGVTYSSKVNLPFDNGDLLVNMSSIGLGRVTYRDVRSHGFALPQEVAGGFAWQATSQLLLAIDLKWQNFSDALQVQTVVASDPDNSLAPSTISSATTLDWRDQTVVAIGAAYARDETTTFYAGINYGRNPIPSSTLNPMLAAIGEWHLTAGYAGVLRNGWRLSASVEYLLPNEVTYFNPELPFGAGARERSSYVALTAMLSKRW